MIRTDDAVYEEELSCVKGVVGGCLKAYSVEERGTVEILDRLFKGATIIIVCHMNLLQIKIYNKICDNDIKCLK